MSQEDCVRVQTVAIELQAAGRRRLLPLALGEMVAVLRGSNPLPVDLSQPDRFLIRSHLESCWFCRAFWTEQQELADLLQEASFELPAEATASRVEKLEGRVVDRVISSYGKPADQEPVWLQKTAAKSGLAQRFRDYWSATREVRVSSNYQVKKLALVAAGALVVVFLVVYFSFMFPPVSQDDVQGAIGKRDVYRETNMTETDVTASSGPGGASYAGLVELLKSPDFKALASNSNYQSLVKEAAFRDLIHNAAFRDVVNLCNRGSQSAVNNLIAGSAYTVNSGLAQHNAFKDLILNQQFKDAVNACSNFKDLVQNSQFKELVSHNNSFKDLVNSNHFQNAMSQGLFTVIQSCNSMKDLVDMTNNAAFKDLATNSNAFRDLVQNSAFNGLVSNQSFTFLSQIQALSQNSQFNDLLTNSNFAGLVSSSQFAGLVSNQAFQALLHDSNFKNVVLSHPQGLIANNSQFKDLVNGSYHELAANSQFQGLISSNAFNNLIKDANFIALLNNNQFQGVLADKQLISYASNANGLNQMVHQSQQVGLVVSGSQNMD